MYNFMNCSVMMFGARVRYSLTYKANQPGIQIYTKKYLHNFKVAITDKNYEGAIGLNFGSLKAYVLASDKTKISVYDQKQFHQIQTLRIPSEKDIGPGNEIIYLAVSPDESRIGVALGFTVIKDEK